MKSLQRFIAEKEEKAGTKRKILVSIITEDNECNGCKKIKKGNPASCTVYREDLEPTKSDGGDLVRLQQCIDDEQ